MTLKKYLLISLIAAMPTFASAAADSSTCYKAVAQSTCESPTPHFFYQGGKGKNGACRAAITDKDAQCPALSGLTKGPKQVWSFDCDSGCYLSNVSTTPSTYSCPAKTFLVDPTGTGLNSTADVSNKCLAVAPLVYDAADSFYKLWDPIFKNPDNSLGRFVGLAFDSVNNAFSITSKLGAPVYTSLSVYPTNANLGYYFPMGASSISFNNNNSSLWLSTASNYGSSVSLKENEIKSETHAFAGNNSSTILTPYSITSTSAEPNGNTSSSSISPTGVITKVDGKDKNINSFTTLFQFNKQMTLQALEYNDNTGVGYKFSEFVVEPTRMIFKIGGGGVMNAILDNILVVTRDYVGIGTADASAQPSSKLAVFSNTADNVSTPSSGITLGNNSQTTGWTHAGIWSVGSVGWNGSLVFGTDGDGTKNNGITEKMRITNDGKVGIGIDNPEEKLHVNGALALTQSIFSEFITGSTIHAPRIYASGNGGTENNLPYPFNSAGHLILQPRVSSPRDIAFATRNNAGTVGTRMVVAASGNVGIGTTDPSQNLHISGAGNQEMRVQTTDAGGSYADIGTKSTGHYFWGYGALPLLFATNGGEKMRIDSAGNVGIGTTAPAQKLDVKGSIGTGAIVVSTTSNTGVFPYTLIQNSGLYSNVSVSNYSSMSGGSIYATGTISGQTLTQRSDLRLKHDIGSLNYGLKDLIKLNPTSYKWNSDNRIDIGFIAQEVEKIIPELVFKDEKGFYSIDYSKITSVIVKAIQEMNVSIDNRFATLEKENAQLKARLEKLEKIVDSL